MKIQHAKEIFRDVNPADKETLKLKYHEKKNHLTQKLEVEKDNAVREELKKSINELNDAYILLQSSDVDNVGVLSIWPLIPLAVFIAFFWWALSVISNQPTNHEPTHDFTSTVYFKGDKQFELNHAQSKELYNLIQSFPKSFNPFTIRRGRSIVSRGKKLNGEFRAVFFLNVEKSPLYRQTVLYRETLCFYSNDSYGIVTYSISGLGGIYRIEIYVVEPNLSPQEMLDFVKNLANTN